jgi:acetoin utilization protein AcuB
VTVLLAAAGRGTANAVARLMAEGRVAVNGRGVRDSAARANPGRDVVTVDEDCPLEEAARIMVDNSIGGLPVMRGDRLVGLITESDLFKTFLEQLGARAQGLRVTVKMAESKGALARLTNDLTAHGADIVSLSTFWGDDLSNRTIVFKVQGITQEQVEQIVGEVDAALVDLRET